MPILRMKEIRELDDKARAKRLENLRNDYFAIVAELSTGGSIKNAGQIKDLKRTIARILTVMREDELGIKPQ